LHPYSSIYTLRDEQNRVATEMTDASSGSSSATLGIIQRDNVFLGNLLVATNGSGTWNYDVSDHLGSIRAAWDTTGTTTETHKYWPYGEDTSLTLNQHLAFQQMERNDGVAQHFDHARTQHYNIGRFLSTDAEHGWATDPQSWNKYTFASGNPLRYEDPDGRLWVATGSTFSWVDSCAKNQACNITVAVADKSGVTIYGSSSAADITHFASNQAGLVDLRSLAGQHDAAFSVKEGAEGFAKPDVAAGFFNAAGDYHLTYPTSSPLFVTDAGNASGTPLPPHVTHDNGRSIDLRYQDGDGHNLIGPTAATRADVARMFHLVDTARSNGLTQNYSARANAFGTLYAPGHETHLHLGQPPEPHP
jgi:RHS repeat-associated protein